MKITKIYSKSTEIEDLSKDKVTITMSWDEYQELRNSLDLARFFNEQKTIEKIYKELKDADKNAKTKWVK